MNPTAKNKLLVWLVALLLVANAATIAMFWLDRAKKGPPPNKSPQLFLIETLQLDTEQQKTLEGLVKAHRETTGFLRMELKKNKEEFFDLVKQPNVTDSIKKTYSEKIAYVTGRLDFYTLNHFQEVRAICRPDQQEKFDEIIQEITRMMGQPRPPMGPGAGGQKGPHEGPPPGGDRPPPPGE